MSDVPAADGVRPTGGLGALLREDWERHSRSVAMPGLHALAVHRIAVWAAERRSPWRRLVGLVARALNALVIRNLYGIEISPTTVVGRRVRIGHHQGVILGYGAVIGDDCLVRQNVTVGQASDDDIRQPVIGKGVELGAGATVVGPVRVGDGARVGPGALVTRHVPAGATAFAAPARILKAPAAEADSAG